MITCRPIFMILLITLGFKSFGANDSLQVLFIGNSLTYFNNMPFTFKSIANTKGKKTAVSMYAPGGTGFANHVADPNVYAAIRSKVWDIVVLQPGTGESGGVSAPANVTAAHGQRLLDSIYLYSKCAKVYLYEISNGVMSASTFANYFASQTVIKNTVKNIADQMNVQLVPAGECIRSRYSANQQVLLHNSYGDVHPNPQGSYLIACAFYSTLFQDSVSRSGFYASLNMADAISYQFIADTVVLTHKARWNINTWNQHADFNYSVSGNTVNFSNTSANASSYTWHFGDGTTSPLQSPSYTYNNAGTFTVSLQTLNQHHCPDSIKKSIRAGTVGISNYSAVSKPICYPNPTTGIAHIHMNGKKQPYEISVFTPSGETVIAQTTADPTVDIDLTNQASGVYVIRIKDQSDSYILKLVKD